MNQIYYHTDKRIQIVNIKQNYPFYTGPNKYIVIQSTGRTYIIIPKLQTLFNYDQAKTMKCFRSILQIYPPRTNCIYFFHFYLSQAKPILFTTSYYQPHF